MEEICNGLPKIGDEVPATFNKTINVTLNLKKGKGFTGSSFLSDLSAQLQKLETTISKSINLSPIVKELKKLDSISVPKIRQLAQGMDLLIKHLNQGNIPSFNPLVKEIQKLSSTSSVALPKLNQFAMGLERLATIHDIRPLSGKINTLSRAFMKFNEVGSLPGITGMVNSLEKLNRINTGAKSTQLVGIANALKSFSSVKKIPNISSLVKGLEKLNKINTGAKSAQLVGIANALKSFSKVGSLPSITSIVNGLDRLTKIDTSKFRNNMREVGIALSGLKKYSKDLSNLAIVMRKAGTASAALKKAVESTKPTMTRFGASIGYVLEKLARYSIYYLTSRAIMFLSQAMQGAISAIASFDQGLKNLQAITQSTSAQTIQMGQRIKQVASDTKFSASEVADGMVVLGQAGLSASESIAAIGPVSNLATATLTDMKSVVDLTTTALRVFNIDANHTSEVADVFASAVTKSKLTIDKLRTAFNFIGPIASQTGLSFKETAASLAVMANSGIRASTQATSLRRVLTNLADPSNKLVNAVNRVGISLKDLDPRSKGFSHTLHALRLVLTNTKTGFIDVGLAASIFGKRGAAGILALVSSSKKFDVMLAKMDDTGLAARMAQKQLEGLVTAWKNLQDKIKNLAIALGETGLSTILKRLIDGTKALTDGFTKFLGTDTGKFIAGVVGITLAITALSAVVAILIGSFELLWVVLASNPVTLAVSLVIIGIATAIGTLSESLKASKSSMDEFITKLAKTKAKLTTEKAQLEDTTTALSKYKKKLDEIAKNKGKANEQELVSKSQLNLLKLFPTYTKDILKAGNSLEGLQKVVKKIDLDTTIKKNDNAIHSFENNLKSLEAQEKVVKDSTEKILKGDLISKNGEKSLMTQALTAMFGEKKLTEEEIKKRTTELSKKLVDARGSIANTLKDLKISYIESPILEAIWPEDKMTKFLKGIGATDHQIKKFFDDVKKNAGKTGEELRKALNLSTGKTAPQITLNYKEYLQNMKTATDKVLLDIKLAEIKGTLTSQQAAEKRRNISIWEADERVKAAQKAYDTIRVLEGQTENSPATVNAKKALAKAEQDSYNARIKLLKNFISKKKSLDTEITTSSNKLKEYNRNIENLETQHYKKLRDIEQSYLDKKKAFQDKLHSIDNTAASSKLSLDSSVDAEIYKLDTKSLDKKQKLISDESRAYKLLADVKTKVSAAMSSGDESALKRTRTLLNEVHSLFSGLSDDSKAKSGLLAYKKVATTVIEDTKKLETKKATSEFAKETKLYLQKKSDEAILYKEKMSHIQTQYQAEQKNIDKLIAKRKQLIALITKYSKIGNNVLSYGVDPKSKAGKEITQILKEAGVEQDKLNTKAVGFETEIKKVNGVWTQVKKNMSNINTKVKVDNSQLMAADNFKMKDKHVRIIETVVRATSATSTQIKRAAGGFVPFLSGAKRGVDSIRALLTPGEYVIKEPIVRRLGTRFFDAISNLQMPQFAYANGGSVGGVEIKNSLGSLSNMGSVSLELGNSSYPVIGNQNVISTLINHLQKEKLMRSN